MYFQFFLVRHLTRIFCRVSGLTFLGGIGLLLSFNSDAADLLQSAKPNQDLLVDAMPGELLVKFNTSFVSRKSRTKANRYKLLKRNRIHGLEIEHWTLDKTQDLRRVIEELKRDPDVLIVEPNYRRYPRTLHAQNFLRLNDLKLPQLWRIESPLYRQRNKIKVAVIDDAFDIAHPDLASNIVAPYDAFSNDNDPSPEVCISPKTKLPAYQKTDPLYWESHGTQVLGVLGAVSGNGEGIDGAANNLDMVPIRISCNYTVAAEIEAFKYAIEQKVDVINLSWGGPQFSEIERLGIAELLKENILIVASAGNYQLNNDRVLDYPSGLDLPNILAVAAVSHRKTLNAWSQYGQTTVDIAAPGDFITTLAINDEYISNLRGSSFSAPFVSGVAASLLMRSPQGLGALEVKAAIMASAVPFADNLKGRLVTDGYVDARAAYDALITPGPLPVISSIIIDDNNVTGNNNGEVDSGENISLNIVVSNVGLSTTFITAELRSITQGNELVAVATANGLKGFDPRRFQYGRTTLQFPIDFSRFDPSQEVAFELKMTSTYGDNNAEQTEITRYFSLDTGSLEMGSSLNRTLRRSTNNQDELHYYQVSLDTAYEALVITLTMEGKNSDIDMLVKYGASPQFSYELSRFNTGSLLGVESGNQETITINNPNRGTYYVVVIADADSVTENISYTLSANTSEKVLQGCSLGKGSPVDPVFYIMLLYSLWRVGKRRT